jgi:phosphate transport system substrate-binding protein
MTVDLCTGINEMSNLNLFSVYPNPTKGVINLKADYNLFGSFYNIYDNTGKFVLTGKIKSWSELGFSKNKEKITVVFDHEQGANARFLRDSIIQGKKFSSNCFALKSNEEVIDYISEHKNAIGVVSVNWVSDRDDPTVEQFLTKVKLMNVGPGDYYDYSKYVKPYQAYIATKQYPLCRCVYAILREPRNGLGTGFVSFIAGEKGQRMFLKAGLVPVNMPIRLVEVTSDNLE